MRKIALAITICMISVAIAFQACTRNNGDIGSYFGTWKLETIDIDGIEDTSYEGDIFWGFQATVFSMRQVADNHSSKQCWGTWEEDGNVLRVDFTHYDDAHPNGENIYTPFASSRMVRGVNSLVIKSKSGSHMELSMTDSVGQSINYSLIKW